MRFDKYFPDDRLKEYVKYFAVSENHLESEYNVFPSLGLVAGFQFKGQLSTKKDNQVTRLEPSGITGISSRYKAFRNTADTGTLLIYFTEVGLAHFTSLPANELYNQSVALTHIFDKNRVNELEEKLASSKSDKQRLSYVEQFLFSQLKNIPTDKLIAEAVKLICQSKGTIRVKELNERLFISQSPLEKRFRKIVGTTPKKFASIVRFNAVLDKLPRSRFLTDLCYEHGFFDQAHFIKNFKQFTGNTPENFKQLV